VNTQHPSSISNTADAIAARLVSLPMMRSPFSPERAAPFGLDRVG
jgi:hypothetical protein